MGFLKFSRLDASLAKSSPVSCGRFSWGCHDPTTIIPFLPPFFHDFLKVLKEKFILTSLKKNCISWHEPLCWILSCILQYFNRKLRHSIRISLEKTCRVCYPSFGKTPQKTKTTLIYPWNSSKNAIFFTNKAETKIPFWMIHLCLKKTMHEFPINQWKSQEDSSGNRGVSDQK